MEWISVKDILPEENLIVRAKTEDMSDNEWLRCCIVNGIWEDDYLDFECDEKYPKISHWMNYGK